MTVERLYPEDENLEKMSIRVQGSSATNTGDINPVFLTIEINEINLYANNQEKIDISVDKIIELKRMIAAAILTAVPEDLSITNRVLNRLGLIRLSDQRIVIDD